MKIIIATPLYPPEIGGSAVYVKELLGRLAKEYEFTVILYGRLPEKIPDVSFICVNKNSLIFTRLFKFFVHLWKNSNKADLIYLENGVSVELPLLFLCFLRKIPIIFHIGDVLAEKKSKKSKIQNQIFKFILKRADFVLRDNPQKTPEILPFGLKPEKEIEEYEKSWEIHINKLKNIFENVRK